jgi:hypothetical protein
MVVRTVKLGSNGNRGRSITRMNVEGTGLIKLRIKGRRIGTTGTSRRRRHECGRKLSESRGSRYHIMRER